jgi:hypothetical protein
MAAIGFEATYDVEIGVPRIHTLQTVWMYNYFCSMGNDIVLFTGGMDVVLE